MDFNQAVKHISDTDEIGAWISHAACGMENFLRECVAL